MYRQTIFFFCFQGRSVGLGFTMDQVVLVRHSLRQWCWIAQLVKVWFGPKSLWTVKARRSTASPSRHMIAVKVLTAPTARNPTSKSLHICPCRTNYDFTYWLLNLNANSTSWLPILIFFFSSRATVHVRVNDVNEFSPVFVERRYEASVPEGRLFDRIVRVEAVDADCSPQYSQICFYDIITPNVPFTIDNDGENCN